MLNASGKLQNVSPSTASHEMNKILKNYLYLVESKLFTVKMFGTFCNLTMSAFMRPRESFF